MKVDGGLFAAISVILLLSLLHFFSRLLRRSMAQHRRTSSPATGAAQLAALLAVALVLPYLVSGSRVLVSNGGFVVRGRVFCDTCRAGFETPATTYIEGAQVRVECRSRITGAKTCSFEGVTDHTGTYNIPVAGEHEHDICESLLFSSPQMGCRTVLKGRERARVFLTHNNGIASDTRYANSLGFEKDTPLPGCTELLKTYEQYEV